MNQEQRPLTIVVRAVDGSIIDAFTEEELTSVAMGAPDKSWQEAVAWAYIGWRQYERRDTV